MKFLFFIKRLIVATLLIYSFDVFLVSLNFVIPINIFTVLLVSFFDVPAIFCMFLFSLFLY
ncbi:MAG: pro-sigmaK processing inhibitor BofA family protein [Bacilli bacterium]|nr:pro-sigmaK processing inhibitor BofA family protein [Bacilli bacterium]